MTLTGSMENNCHITCQFPKQTYLDALPMCFMLVLGKLYIYLMTNTKLSVHLQLKSVGSGTIQSTNYLLKL